MKNLKKGPYQGNLIKDLKIVLIKDLKNTLSSCLNKRSKKLSNKASLRTLIYAFLLEASKTCDLSLIQNKRCSINSTKFRSGYPKTSKACKSLFLS